jgi:hypothetical protein
VSALPLQHMRWLAIVSLGALVACSKHKPEGLPPATEWSATNVAPGVQLDESADNDPHAGLDMSGTQSADDDTGGNQALPPGHPSVTGGATGGAAGGDMSQATGLPPPDPNRPIDPSHRIAGIVKIAPALAGMVGNAKPLFLSVKRPDAAGNPIGTAIAVEKLTWAPDTGTKAGIAFELTDRDAMVGTGDTLSGDVVVIAHYDNDGDAISKTSGDVLGTARVTVPADNVTITLDTPIP